VIYESERRYQNDLWDEQESQNLRTESTTKRTRRKKKRKKRKTTTVAEVVTEDGNDQQASEKAIPYLIESV